MSVYHEKCRADPNAYILPSKITLLLHYHSLVTIAIYYLPLPSSAIPFGHPIFPDTSVCRLLPLRSARSILGWSPQSVQYVRLKQVEQTYMSHIYKARSSLLVCFVHKAEKKGPNISLSNDHTGVIFTKPEQPLSYVQCMRLKRKDQCAVMII